MHAYNEDNVTFTKRNVLSKINSIFDPLGLVSPLTVKAKILMRKIWMIEPKLGWDDKLPEKLSIE